MKGEEKREDKEPGTMYQVQQENIQNRQKYAPKKREI